MDIYFCKYWSYLNRFAPEPLTEGKARDAHERGQWYTAMIGASSRPQCLIEVAPKTIGVHFLDESLRDRLSCTYREFDQRSTFLTLVTRRQYRPDDRIASSVTHLFDTRGNVQIRREWYHPLRVEFDRCRLDVVPNRLAKPDFCRYDDLIALDRSQDLEEALRLTDAVPASAVQPLLIDTALAQK